MGWRKLKRPRLRTVLFMVNAVVLVLPLLYIGTVRLYQNELIRQTESQLIAQGAAIRASFLVEFSALDKTTRDKIHSKAIPIAPMWAPLFKLSDSFPFYAKLDRSQETLRAPAQKPITNAPAAHPDMVTIGQKLTAIMKSTQKVTLCGIRVVDYNGVVIGTTRGELGLSLINREEVKRALRGEHLSLLRKRISDEPPPPLTSLSRRTDVRVFVAMPVVFNGRVLGTVILSRTPKSELKALYQNRPYLTWGGCLLLTLIVIISLTTSFTINRPINNLIKQTQNIADGSQTRITPLSNPGTYEIAQLSAAFVKMAKALNDRSDYIRTFASNVSHEFKSPLTSIHGTVELLKDHMNEMSREELDRFLDNLTQDAVRLDRLVKRLLELARADVTQPEKTGCDALKITQQVIQRFQTGGLDIIFNQPDKNPLMVLMAPEIFSSILSNLLDNSVQHGGAGVTVTVDILLSEDKKRLKLQVKDDGSGISEANASRIFDNFFTTARQTGGTGLGLSIVKSLLAAHNGTIELAEGIQGTCFLISLPLGQ